MEENNEYEPLISISMKEYRELLIIKGRYEELKEKQAIIQFKEPSLTRREPDIAFYKTNDPIPETPYKITCEGENNYGKHTR